MLETAHEKAPRFIGLIADVVDHPASAVLRALQGGPLRLSEISGTLARLDERNLAATLRELDGDGLVARHVESGPPLRVLYELTALGSQLAPSLDELFTCVARPSVHA